MGEKDEDLIDLAMALIEVKPDSIPLNMLHPATGTPLEHCDNLTPQRCLKVLCLFRFLHPRTELRIAGGREHNLRSLQPLGALSSRLRLRERLPHDTRPAGPGSLGHDRRSGLQDRSGLPAAGQHITQDSILFISQPLYHRLPCCPASRPIARHQCSGERECDRLQNHAARNRHLNSPAKGLFIDHVDKHQRE